ncbi:hypothetical protein ACSBLW_11660 [Thioclava sp. FR2]|uniref:hypothetical protein n=1 Tax=Thioclava sp. FR2 TaxID=3445780 RepID=UPI003EBA2356
MMEPDLTIPKDLKRKKPLRLITLMGITVLCFILLAKAGRAVAETLALVTVITG